MDTGPVIDRKIYGNLLRAARIAAGYDKVDDASEAITDRVGYKISSRTLYALERGEQSVTLEQHVAILFGYDPPGGPDFFRRSLRPDMARVLRATMHDG